MYDGLFFALTHKLDVLTRYSAKALMKKGNKSSYAPKIDEYYDSDEEEDDHDGQSWMQEEDPEKLIDIDWLHEPLDEFERKETFDEEEGKSFITATVKASGDKRMKKDAEGADTPPLPKKFKTKDARVQMAYFDRPLNMKIPILPLIHSSVSLLNET